MLPYQLQDLPKLRTLNQEHSETHNRAFRGDFPDISQVVGNMVPSHFFSTLRTVVHNAVVIATPLVMFKGINVLLPNEL